MRKPLELTPEELSAPADPSQFRGGTSKIEPLSGFIGQKRAEEALIFGLMNQSDGYNVLIANPSGSGRQSALLESVKKTISSRMDAPVLHDYCYVHNFQDPEKPRLIVLPAGQGNQLREIIQSLLKEIKILPKKLVEEIELRIRGAYQKTALELGEEYKDSPFVIAYVETHEGSKIECWVEDEDKNTITVERWIKESPNTEVSDLRTQTWRTFYESVQGRNILLRKEMTETEVILTKSQEENFEKLLKEHTEACLDRFPDADAYIIGLDAYIRDNKEQLLDEEDPNGQIVQLGAGQLQMASPAEDSDIEKPFAVNVYVENDPNATSPPLVVTEDMLYEKIFGGIRIHTQFGTSYTDHTKLVAGNVARANGGFLLINGNEILSSPHGSAIWPSILEILKYKKLDTRGLLKFGSSNIEPDQIPLDIKVVLVTDMNLYYEMTQQFSDTVESFFRARVEFTDVTSRTPENEQKYAAFIAMQVERQSLLHVDASAIVQIIEYSSRLAEDKYKLSLNMRNIKTVLIEANSLATQRKAHRISKSHILNALAKQEDRIGLIKERMYDNIKDGFFLLRLEGEEVGRANALTVIGADLPFGRPNTITASIASGNNLLSIDRSAGFTEGTFDKSFDTVAAFVRAQYGTKHPLPWTISISMEQSYGDIAGDSASAIEVFLCLSVLGNIPLRQDIGVTGSMNQYGQIQGIGGANEKIEGFFDVCKMIHGLSGQGVIIPRSNVRTLVLRPDVVDACRKGIFHIWAIDRVEEGMEILSRKSIKQVNEKIRKRISAQIKYSRQNPNNKTNRTKKPIGFRKGRS